MSISGIHGQILEVTVISCNKLRNTEWFSRQDPYVCLEYASTKFRTRTCTDGGKDPSFQEKFTFSLIEGLRDLSVVVWNSNTLANDDFIGTGKIHLQKVLSTGYDDSSWSLQDDKGRNGGYVQLIMYYPTANNLITPPPVLYTVVQAPTPKVHHYYAPPPSVTVPYPPISYPTPPSYPPSHPLPHPAGYPPPPQYSNEPTIYLPTHPPSVTYPPTYPPYPPPHLSYPQLPQDTRYYSQGSYYPQPPN